MNVDELKAWAQKQAEHERLYDAVLDQRAACTDEGVYKFFDMESEKMLRKKLRVLQALNDGKDKEEIGDDYFAILEKLPRDAEGNISIVIDW